MFNKRQRRFSKIHCINEKRVEYFTIWKDIHFLKHSKRDYSFIEMSIEGGFLLNEGIFIGKEKRAHMRKQINVPVIYGYFRGQTFIMNSGTTFDLSDAGMSFYTDKPFRKGKNLQFQSSYLWRRPRVGTVRWCNMKTVFLYKVGILFR